MFDMRVHGYMFYTEIQLEDVKHCWMERRRVWRIFEREEDVLMSDEASMHETKCLRSK